MNEELRNTQDGNRNFNLTIQELNAKLIQIVSERDDLGRRVDMLGGEDQNTKRRLQQYESKVTMLSQQIERLNNILKQKVDELNVSEQRVRSLSQEIQSVRIQFNQSETHITQTWQSKITLFERDNEELKRKLSEYENRISLMASEIERLNGTLKVKV